MLASLSPARRRMVLLIAAVAAAAVVIAAVVIVRSVQAAEVRPVAQNLPGPVLLVPGYGGSTKALDVLAAALRAQGRDATVVELLGDGTGDLDAEAGVLADAADAALSRTGAPSVDVIGYSAGGVVARLWVRDHGGANQARRVLTLGSPHHGTTVAGLAVDVAPSQCPLACHQLDPDSDLLRALNTGDETPAGPVFVSIWTTVDDTVTPPDSARLSGALNFTVQSICADSEVSHGELPTIPLIAGIVETELGAGGLVTLSESDCQRLSS